MSTRDVVGTGAWPMISCLSCGQTHIHAACHAGDCAYVCETCAGASPPAAPEATTAARTSPQAPVRSVGAEATARVPAGAPARPAYDCARCRDSPRGCDRCRAPLVIPVPAPLANASNVSSVFLGTRKARKTHIASPRSCSEAPQPVLAPKPAEVMRRAPAPKPRKPAELPKPAPARTTPIDPIGAPLLCENLLMCSEEALDAEASNTVRNILSNLGPDALQKAAFYARSLLKQIDVALPLQLSDPAPVIAEQQDMLPAPAPRPAKPILSVHQSDARPPPGGGLGGPPQGFPQQASGQRPQFYGYPGGHFYPPPAALGEATTKGGRRRRPAPGDPGLGIACFR